MKLCLIRRNLLVPSVLVSLGLHYLVLGSLPTAEARSAPRKAEMRFVTLPPLPPEEAPEPDVKPAPEEPTEEKAEPTPKPVQPQELVEAPVAPEPEPVESEPVESQPAAEPVEELTGTTLAALGDGAFDAPLGSGRARRGAFRAGVSRAVEAAARPKAPKPIQPVAKPQAPPALPLAKLGRPPAPPDLTGSLARYYPPSARSQGKSGEAKVRARIEPNGSIRQAKVVAESSEGFGSACRQTLLESTWRAPLDKERRPVATWVTYRCRFRVSD